MLRATWDNIDFEAQTLTVDKTLNPRDKNNIYYLGSPKTSTSSRTIYISPLLISILKKHRKKQLQNRLFYGALYTWQYLDEDNNIIFESKDGNKQFIDLYAQRKMAGY